MKIYSIQYNYRALVIYESNIKADTDDFNDVFEENVVGLTHNDRALIYFYIDVRSINKEVGYIYQEVLLMKKPLHN